MKLLFDENLSPRLIDVLRDEYPDSSHVHLVGLGSSDDVAIWAYARIPTSVRTVSGLLSSTIFS
ncbi:MAG: DUF5615 family PIN-like protein [Burkholderiales bacterium]|nr:DUF5615 family PIN-like protein [Burkholderiales bacterium]